MTSNLIKTKFPGIYYKQDSKTKVKTYIARIKVVGVINTEQIVGISDGPNRINPSQAYELRSKLINEAKAGKSIKAKDDPTLEELFNEYIEFKKPTISERWYKTQINNFKNIIDNKLKPKKFKVLSLNDLQKNVNKLIDKGHSGRYIKFSKEIFSQLYKYALTNSICDKDLSPLIKIPKYDNLRYFTLEDEKIKALYQKILEIPNNKYRVMFLFKLRGRRNKEILTLSWEDINFKNNEYIIREENSKITENLKFDIDEELLEQLKILYTINQTGYIFLNPETNKPYTAIPKRLWNKIRDELDLKDMTLHDFRHLLGFKLMNSDIPIEITSRTLGHKSIRTTQKYSTMTKKMAKEGTDSFLNMLK